MKMSAQARRSPSPPSRKTAQAKEPTWRINGFSGLLVGHCIMLADQKVVVALALAAVIAPSFSFAPPRPATLSPDRATGRPFRTRTCAPPRASSLPALRRIAGAARASGLPLFVARQRHRHVIALGHRHQAHVESAARGLRHNPIAFIVRQLRLPPLRGLRRGSPPDLEGAGERDSLRQYRRTAAHPRSRWRGAAAGRHAALFWHLASPVRYRETRFLATLALGGYLGGDLLSDLVDIGIEVIHRFKLDALAQSS
jgi:hypothetical protein